MLCEAPRHMVCQGVRVRICICSLDCVGAGSKRRCLLTETGREVMQKYLLCSMANCIVFIHLPLLWLPPPLHRVRACKGVVVAAGVWSGQLLAAATGQPTWQQLLQPRKGHLLEVVPPAGMPLVHTGMMELSYTHHYSATASAAVSAAEGPGEGVHVHAGSSHQPVDITFTATTSASGTLLIGECCLSHTSHFTQPFGWQMHVLRQGWPPC